MPPRKREPRPKPASEAASVSRTTCSRTGEIRLWGDALRATCQNSTGQWLETSLRDFSQCVGDIVNDEGTLRCSMGTAPPTGPYTQSCRNIYFHAGALHAAR